MQQRSIFQHNTVLSASIVVQFAGKKTWYNVGAFSLLDCVGPGEDSLSVYVLTDSGLQLSISVSSNVYMLSSSSHSYCTADSILTTLTLGQRLSN